MILTATTTENKTDFFFYLKKECINPAINGLSDRHSLKRNKKYAKF